MFGDHTSDLVDALVRKNGNEDMIAARAVEVKRPVWRFRWMG
jgi:hypothetical protein